MRYLLLTASGDLQSRDGDYEADLGAHGVAHVWLPRRPLHAMVPESGLLLPDLYPRNPLGTVLLMNLGAPPQAYAGPVVLAGWSGSAVVGVDEGSATLVELLHGRIRGALADDPAASVPRTALLRDWSRDVRAIAEAVRVGPLPPVVTVSDCGWN